MLPLNFRYPYASLGFSDFWRRWHISLSSWLRDYLYILLGGNRGSTLATYRNLAATMLLGGLWHGAAWTYVFWGGLHGSYLVGERLIRTRLGKGEPSRRTTIIAIWLLTFLLTLVAWVFFRADSFMGAVSYLGTMAHPERLALRIISPDNAALAAIGIVLLIAYSVVMRDRSFSAIWSGLPAPLRMLVLSATTAVTIFWQGAPVEFIYFRF